MADVRSWLWRLMLDLRRRGALDHLARVTKLPLKLRTNVSIDKPGDGELRTFKR